MIKAIFGLIGFISIILWGSLLVRSWANIGMINTWKLLKNSDKYFKEKNDD